MRVRVEARRSLAAIAVPIVTRRANGGLYENRAVEPLAPICEREGVKKIRVIAWAAGIGGDIDGSTGAVDRRRAKDADLRFYIRVWTGVAGQIVEVAATDGGSEIHFPNGSSGQIVGVQGVDAVVHRGHQQNVHRSSSRDFQRVDEKRLSVDLAIDDAGRQLAELGRIHVVGVEEVFVRGCVGALVTVICR